MLCQRCGHPQLELTPAAARCMRCYQLHTQQGDQWVPLVVQAPGGGENDEFNAIFERQLGFGPRPMPLLAPAPANPLVKIIGWSVGCFVAFILVSVAIFVAVTLRSALP